MSKLREMVKIREVRCVAGHGVTNSQKQLNDRTATRAQLIKGLSRGHSWQRTHMSVQEMKEMRGPSLGQEDPLEDEMATHPRILAWRIPRTEGPGRLQSMGLQRVRYD